MPSLEAFLPERTAEAESGVGTFRWSVFKFPSPTASKARGSRGSRKRAVGGWGYYLSLLFVGSVQLLGLSGSLFLVGWRDRGVTSSRSDGSMLENWKSGSWPNIGAHGVGPFPNNALLGREPRLINLERGWKCAGPCNLSMLVPG